jgi:hypothetical protein
MTRGSRHHRAHFNEIAYCDLSTGTNSNDRLHPDSKTKITKFGQFMKHVGGIVRLDEGRQTE